MHDRLKVLDNVAARVAVNPLIPAEVRAGVAELAALCRELVDEVTDLRAELAEASYQGDE